MFWALKLSKNADSDKCSCSEYDIGFHSCSLFSPPNLDWSENVIIFGVENSSSVHIANKKKNIIVIGGGPTQGLDDTKINQKLNISLLFQYQEFFLLKSAF